MKNKIRRGSKSDTKNYWRLAVSFHKLKDIDLVEDIDILSKEYNVSRSWLVRELVRKGLGYPSRL